MASKLKLANSSGTTQNLPEMANIMNNYFDSVRPKLAHNIPPSTRDFKDYLGNSHSPNSFYFNTVTPFEIEMEILITPSNKAYGR